MKKLVGGVAASACIALALSAGPLRVAAQNAGASAVVIQGGTLIDGNGGAPVPNSVVVIQGNRIIAVGRAGAVQVPAGAQIINANGKYVLPGLWDAQTNIAWYWGEVFLNQGVTSTVDIGDGEEISIAQRDAVNHGKAIGPRQMIGIGHLGGIRGNNAPTGMESALATRKDPKSPDDARMFARRFLGAGADMVMLHDGSYAPEIYQAAFDEAHKANKPAFCRCGGPKTGPKEGALAGADIFPHSTGIGAAVATDGTRANNELDRYAEMDDAKANDLIKVLVEHHVNLVPTLVHDSPSYPKGWQRFQAEARKTFQDPNLRAYYDGDNIRSFFATYNHIDPPNVHERRARGFANMLRFNKMYDAAGGHVLAGGDTNNEKAPGFILHDEMETMAEAGIPAMHVIQGATKWTAEAMHVADKIGTVEAGKIADVLVVDADPLADIANLRKVSTVVFDGKPVELGYHAWYATPFAGGAEDRSVVDNVAWAQSLKQATFRAPQGENAQAPDPVDSPQPAIETITPVMIAEGSPTTTLTLKGFNFVRRSRVYFDGESVPYKRVSATELQVTLDENLLKRAGRFDIVVKNPEPLANKQWGNGESNAAHLLVTFAFTTSVRAANAN
ncbi:MAG TPA: amidohydrolase family protein [Micropepsaceae bacterium]|nr:amidohydrolase family protein [Micropepsaceae bacterium]